MTAPGHAPASTPRTHGSATRHGPLSRAIKTFASHPSLKTLASPFRLFIRLLLLLGPRAGGAHRRRSNRQPVSNITRTSSSLPPPVGSERLGKRNNHQRGEEEHSENAKRGENAGHGRTILRAATRPACRVTRRYPRLSKVQSVDQRMRLACGVGFRRLRTCRRTRPGRYVPNKRHSRIVIRAPCRREQGPNPVEIWRIFAVFRLMESSIRVGCSTGRSLGFVPSSIFLT